MKNPGLSKQHFDAIVIGVGSMGSAACYHLAKRGYRVLGIEQFDIPHQKGSHTGQSRIIRKAYFEHPNYVPLLESAYENWKALEQATGRQLFYKTGFAYFGLPESDLLTGVRRSATQYSIPINTFESKEDIQDSFPQFNIPEPYEAILEPEAGFALPEETIQTYVDEVVKLGGTINTNETVLEWDREGEGVKVKTDKNTYVAQRLVISAGAWTSQLIPELGKSLQTTRQLLFWMKPKRKSPFLLNTFPCWTVADEDYPGIFYGFPIMRKPGRFSEVGLKFAHHHPGEVIHPKDKDLFDKTTEMKKLVSILSKYLPEAYEKTLSVKSCIYTNTPDQDFVIDQLPGFEEYVTIACGFSGHGFKFAPVVGEILADLAIKGRTEHPIGFLSVSRL